jgi:hypothetical protein
VFFFKKIEFDICNLNTKDIPKLSERTMSLTSTKANMDRANNRMVVPIPEASDVITNNTDLQGWAKGVEIEAKLNDDGHLMTGTGYICPIDLGDDGITKIIASAEEILLGFDEYKDVPDEYRFKNLPVHGSKQKPLFLAALVYQYIYGTQHHVERKLKEFYENGKPDPTVMYMMDTVVPLTDGRQQACPNTYLLTETGLMFMIGGVQTPFTKVFMGLLIGLINNINDNHTEIFDASLAEETDKLKAEIEAQRAEIEAQRAELAKKDRAIRKCNKAIGCMQVAVVDTNKQSAIASRYSVSDNHETVIRETRALRQKFLGSVLISVVSYDFIKRHIKKSKPDKKAKPAKKTRSKGKGKDKGNSSLSGKTIEGITFSDSDDASTPPPPPVQSSAYAGFSGMYEDNDNDAYDYKMYTYWGDFDVDKPERNTDLYFMIDSKLGKHATIDKELERVSNLGISMENDTGKKPHANQINYNKQPTASLTFVNQKHLDNFHVLMKEKNGPHDAMTGCRINNVHFCSYDDIDDARNTSLFKTLGYKSKSTRARVPRRPGLNSFQPRATNDDFRYLP